MILDTSVLVDLLRGDEKVVEKIKKCEKEREDLKTTSITAFELYYGAYKSSKREENIDLVSKLLKSMEVLGFDLEASRIAGSLLADLTKKGGPLEMRDLFIAAIALKTGDKIATRDKDFLRIEKLKIEYW
ncbi:MAG: hypothetical protein DRJ38_07350 [Thermoprotei archaeon]|nr:MAG: hypothetical protein DRJ38_07350 [Thermoprotei archaeon]